MEGMRSGRPLRELLGADPEVAKRLDATQLDAAFDPKHALRWTDAIFKRIFGTAAKRPAAPRVAERPRGREVTT